MTGKKFDPQKPLLSKRSCQSCAQGARPFSPRQSRELLRQINGNWILSANARKINRIFKFKNFLDALKLANQIGRLAERENHHPDLMVSWGSLVVELWTHSTGGLTENDFILAAKIDHLIEDVF